MRANLGMFIALSISGAACATATRMPSVTDIAGEMEHQRCGPDVENGSLKAIWTGEAIVRYDPAYLASATCGAGAGGCYKRLAGAVITLRALECHSARRVLGKIPPDEIPNDPFWLPGKTVDIDVVSTGREFAATVRSFEVSDAQEILNRAKAFVEPGPAR